MLRIVRAEDERRWDNDLRTLLSDRNPEVRSRAALAAGRIGDERSITDLISLLRNDADTNVKAMAAFALGETESALSSDALLSTLKETSEPLLRARVVEALGKVAAALPTERAARAPELGAAIIEALSFAGKPLSAADRLTVLLGITAALRAKPANAGPALARFLSDPDPRIRADAANALARLRIKDGNDQLRKLLTSDPDPIVRANAARVLAATEDKASFDALLDRALNDKDARVRVSAIRSLAALSDARATEPLLKRGKQLLAAASPRILPPSETNEMLEIAGTVGRTAENTRSETALEFVEAARAVVGQTSPEVEIAKARIAPQLYTIDLQVTPEKNALVTDNNWRVWSAMAQGAATLATVKTARPLLETSIKEEAIRTLTNRISCPQNSGLRKPRRVRIRPNSVIAVFCTPISLLALPEWLRAYASFKQSGLAEVLRKHLGERDVVVRATAAELLGELLPDQANSQALIDALPVALTDKQLNDAALAILDSLAKQKSTTANEAIKTALNSPDHLIRRKAVALLKANGAGDFSSRIGTVASRNTMADYQRAIARIGMPVSAVVTTSKGAFTIQLLPDEAPLNVDNFIQLAKRRYFDGITFHRVVPNFVIQGGDPRGDGNGGPGYQIRCEINQLPYERAAVGMALSGKDTGGSQWFVTHSPQPHLDGGYTVFGNVIAGMDVVDNIVRGDTIRSIVVRETARTSTRRP